MPILSAQKPGRKSISKEEKKIKMRDIEYEKEEWERVEYAWENVLAFENSKQKTELLKNKKNTGNIVIGKTFCFEL